MPLIVYNGGLLVKNGSLAASLNCCCGPPGCPPGCPNIDNCYLVIVNDYGAFQDEEINQLASFYKKGQYSNCQLEFYSGDKTDEAGGDYYLEATIGYDDNCCPILSNVVFGRPGPCDGSDPNVNCLKVIVSLVCGNACCSPTWVFGTNYASGQGEGETPTIIPCNPLP